MGAPFLRIRILEHRSPLTFYSGFPGSELPQHHQSVRPPCGLLYDVSTPGAELCLLEPKKVTAAFSTGPILGLQCGQLGHPGHPGPLLPGTTRVDESMVAPAVPPGASCSGCPWWNWAGRCECHEHKHGVRILVSDVLQSALLTYPWVQGNQGHQDM